MFRIIKDFPNYSINENGEVLNNKTNKILKILKCNRGYCRLNLRKNNKSYGNYIHRLVAKTFIPNPNNLVCIDHIDRNKENNNLNNLRWVNHSENNINRFVRGNIKYRHLYIQKTSFIIKIRRNTKIIFTKCLSMKKYTLEDVVNERNKQYKKFGITIDDD